MAVKPHGEHETVNALAKLLGSTRRTISARIRSSGLKPTGARRGFPIYQVAAVRALLQAPTDPNKMTAFQRGAHFKAEILERQIKDLCAQLCRREDAEAELQRIARFLDVALDVLPRRLARVCRLSAEVELRIKGHVSEARRSIRALEAERESRWAGKADAKETSHA